MPETFRPVRPFRQWPKFNPKAFDPRQNPFIPAGSITNDMIHDVQPQKVQFRGIKLYNSATQSLNDGATTALTYDTTSYNRGFPTPTSSLITIPRNGIYDIVAVVFYAANATGRRGAFLVYSGVSVEGYSIAATNAGICGSTIMSQRNLMQGDTVGVNGLQTSGGALNVGAGENSAALSVTYLGSI